MRKIDIGTEDIGVLKHIKEVLTEYGCHPILHLTHKKGIKTGYGVHSSDLWQLCIGKKDDVLTLLQELPLQHNDKVRMKDLTLDTKDATYWSEIKGRVVALRKQIGDEIDQFKLESEREV